MLSAIVDSVWLSLLVFVMEFSMDWNCFCCFVFSSAF